MIIQGFHQDCNMEKELPFLFYKFAELPYTWPWKCSKMARFQINWWSNSMTWKNFISKDLLEMISLHHTTWLVLMRMPMI